MSSLLSLRTPGRRLALAGFLIVLWIVAGAHPAHAAFPGANGKIAFDRTTFPPAAQPARGASSWGAVGRRSTRTRGLSTQTDQIWQMNPDGSLAVDISNSGLLDEAANWSADGTKLVFDRYDNSGQDQVRVMNADGTGQQNLPNDPNSYDFSPAWSPDRSKIAYVHLNPDTGDDEIWVMNADGTDRHLAVTPDAFSDDEQPNWSPDGTKIAFTRYPDGPGQIFVANADGSGSPQNLSNNSDYDEDPNWSPDGTKLVFAKIPTGGFGDSQIWVMNADGSSPHAITTPNTPPTVAGAHYDASPAFSPDGTQVTYEREAGFLETVPLQFTIWVAGADGANAHQVSSPDSSANDFLPDWQPVGGPASAATLPTACTSNPSVVVHASDATGFKSPVNVHYKVDGGAEQVVAVDGSGNAAVSVANGKHTLEYWAGDAAGYQEAAHHTGTVTVDTLTGCVPAKVSVAGVRRACVSKAFGIRVRIATKARPRSVRVYLGNERLVTTTKTSFRLRIKPKHLGRRTRLRIVATDASGHVTTITRTIAHCAVAKSRRRAAPRFTG